MRGTSSSISALCEQPPHPFAVGDLLKWDPTGRVHPHTVWRNLHDDPLARNSKRLFPLCLLGLAIWKYLLSSKNEKFVLFKSQHFSPVYQKYPCGCYSPSRRTLFFRILGGTDIPRPASTLFSYPAPVPWNDSLAAIYWHRLSSCRWVGIAFRPQSCWQDRLAPSCMSASWLPGGL